MAGLILFLTRASMSLPVTKRDASFSLLEKRPPRPMPRRVLHFSRDEKRAPPVPCTGSPGGKPTRIMHCTFFAVRGCATPPASADGWESPRWARAGTRGRGASSAPDPELVGRGHVDELAADHRGKRLDRRDGALGHGEEIGGKHDEVG